MNNPADARSKAKERPVVICVDDDPAILSALSRTLRDESYEVLTTVRPDEALHWIEIRDVALILCDQLMPGQWGTELLERVRLRSPDTARAILTGCPSMLVCGRGPMAGVDRTFLKPWDNQSLREAIRKIVLERSADPKKDPLRRNSRRKG